MAGRPVTKFIEHLRTVTLRRDGAGLPDEQLLRLFVDHHEEAAFAAIVKRHGPMVMGVCRRVLGSHQDAEDAFQATFLVLVRKAGSIAKRDLLSNWLYGVAYNVALKGRTAAARRRLREKQLSGVTDREAVPREQIWHDLLPLLDCELSRLPAKYRVPIVLCDLEGKAHKQAAKQLGWPVGTVSGRLSRGRTLLAKRLTRHGLCLSAGSLAILFSQNAAPASVSISLVSATIKAATLFAVGKAAMPGAISPQIIKLTNGALKSMTLTKYLLGTAMLVGLTLVGARVGISAYGSKVQTRATVEEQPTQAAGQKSKTAQEPLLVAAASVALADKNILKNSGIEEGKEAPDQWSQGAEIDGVEYTWDKKAGFKSKASLCLNKTAKRYFPIAQWYQIVDRQGASPELRLSAQVKAEKATKAVLDVIFLDDKEDSISHEWAAYIGAKNAGDPPADHDWKEYSGKVKIPPGTKKIQIGLQIYGPGKVWFDDVRAEYAE